MAGGRRNPSNYKNNKHSIKKRPSSKSNYSSVRSRLFVDGGFLSDWPSHSSSPFYSQGRKRSGISPKSAPKSGYSDRPTVSGPNFRAEKYNRNVCGYSYPSVDLEEDMHAEPCVLSNNEDSCLDEAQPIALVRTDETQIYAYIDHTPLSKLQNMEYYYDYGSSFVLGDSSCGESGFCLESETMTTPCVTGSSSKHAKEQRGSCLGLSSSKKEIDAHHIVNSTLGTEMEEEMVVEIPRKSNSAFVAVGGIKIYTRDVSDVENEEGVNMESLDEENLESSESGEIDEFSGSGRSESMDYNDSDVDDDVADDYIEGIGGNNHILDAKWLTEQALHESNHGTSSSSTVEEAFEKLGGNVFRDASREYGRKRTWSRMKHFIRNPGRYSVKQKHASRFPKSWPSEAQKSKASRRFPGERKKYHKETIAMKCRERLSRRGVDLEQINLELEQMVLTGVEMFCFPPMHSRDCSQVLRLASIYHLQSGCQGSGKKRYVTVTQTQQTCMPSTSDKLRLDKLIQSAKEELDFSLEGSVGVNKNMAKRRKKASCSRPPNAQGMDRTKSSERRQSRKVGSYATQPVSFVASGITRSETVDVTKVESKVESSKENNVHEKNSVACSEIGAFELHTTGFGSKIMAKMGFVEGCGLGKDGQGMAKPIEVKKRPKSLGLGVEFSDNIGKPTELPKIKSRVKESRSSNPQNMGSFEKHTRGFGSKIMAKMGFVEGAGLGKNSQGMVKPLVAVRLPKSRGLGAKAKD